jgi:hypothetical protein
VHARVLAVNLHVTLDRLGQPCVLVGVGQPLGELRNAKRFEEAFAGEDLRILALGHLGQFSLNLLFAQRHEVDGHADRLAVVAEVVEVQHQRLVQLQVALLVHVGIAGLAGLPGQAGAARLQQQRVARRQLHDAERHDRHAP